MLRGWGGGGGQTVQNMKTSHKYRPGKLAISCRTSGKLEVRYDTRQDNWRMVGGFKWQQRKDEWGAKGGGGSKSVLPEKPASLRCREDG